jgi:hypothetical protein
MKCLEDLAKSRGLHVLRVRLSRALYLRIRDTVLADAILGGLCCEDLSSASATGDRDCRR